MENFGRYKIIKKLGNGAMGIVYLAYDPHLDREIALKVLRQPHGDGDDLEKKRFMKEAQILARLDHPNIVRIYDISIEGNSPFISMEYISGQSLKQFIDSHPNITLQQKINIAKQIIQGLSAIHKSIMAHRDLKPANILIDKDGNVKIMDFGISKDMDSTMTMPNELLGSPSYMSPEQINSQAIDHRSDIFSYGIILYELFNNRNPFLGTTIQSTFFNILNKNITEKELVPDESIPGLTRIISKCLNKRKEDRFANAAEIEMALATLSPVPYPPQRRAEKGSWLALTLSVIVFAAGLTSYFKSPGKSSTRSVASASRLPEVQNYYQILGRCGDNVCDSLERKCKKACPADCPDSVDASTQTCKDGLGEALSLFANKYPSLKCGDGVCTFLERKCGVCEQDCPGVTSSLEAPACFNLQKSLAIQPGEDPNKLSDSVNARIAYDDCSFSINKQDLDVSSYIKEMMDCLRKPDLPRITACRQQAISNGGSPRNFFKCIISGIETETRESE